MGLKRLLGVVKLSSRMNVSHLRLTVMFRCPRQLHRCSDALRDKVRLTRYVLLLVILLLMLSLIAKKECST